ncbi:MAG TPA: ABC transporter permease [Chloroflexi bacterium]|nr:ABC transporter permease [Chloroflexota bacterium]
MARYILYRMAHGLVVLVGVSVVVFLLMHLSGDPAAVLLPLDTPPEDVAIFRREMGLDRPLPVQYAHFLSRAVRGNFGYSYHYRTDALFIVLQRLPATLKLAGAALLFSLFFSLPAGFVAATLKDTWWDLLIRSFVLVGQAVPGFWLALVLIMLLAVRWQWFPVSGSQGWQSLVLPAITAGSFSMATVTYILRSSLLEVMAKEYILTAHSKGVGPWAVLTRHALKNAAIPVMAVIGVQIGWLLGGSVVAEVIFAYPGMGRLAVNSIGYRDLPVLQAFVAVMAVLVVLLNLGLDVLYAWLDPRIRLYG